MCDTGEELTREDGLVQKSETNRWGEKGMRIHVAWKEICVLVSDHDL